MEEMKEILYSIQEVSERLDISYRQLHYWEEKLELQITRDNSGNRQYSENDIELLERVKELKIRGMSMDGIKALLREKGILPEPVPKNVIIVDDKAMELKSYILNEIRDVFAQELQQTNHNLCLTLEKIETVLKENQELKDEICKLQKQGEDHYNKIDSQITAWRNKKPWYKKIFFKK